MSTLSKQISEAISKHQSSYAQRTKEALNLSKKALGAFDHSLLAQIIVSQDEGDNFSKALAGERKSEKTQVTLAGSGVSIAQETEIVDHGSGTIDPRQVTLSSGATSVLLKPPKQLTNRIGKVYRKKTIGNEGYEAIKEYDDAEGKKDSVDVYLFSGKTGVIEGQSGAVSTMGQVAYDREKNEIVISFRCSRQSSVAGVLEGAVLDSVNSDWKTNGNMYKVDSFPEIAAGGKIVSSFANAYLSCRPELIEIIKTIRKENPKANLLFDGYSLGGALATVGWLDAQTGTLANELGDDNEAKDMCRGAECFAIATPYVCSKEAIDKINALEGPNKVPPGKYHRVYYKNDLVGFGGNLLRVLKGKWGWGKDPELLQHIQSPIAANINLGICKGLGIPAAMSAPHEFYLQSEDVQRKAGVPESKIERLWNSLNKNMEIVHSRSFAKKSLSKEDAAQIASQYDYNYVIKSAIKRARLNIKDSELKQYVHAGEQMFERLNKKPPENEEEFEAFKQMLTNLTKEFGSKAISNESEGLPKRNKQSEARACYSNLIIGVLNVRLRLIDGVINWFEFKKSKANGKSESLLGQGIKRLKKLSEKIAILRDKQAAKSHRKARLTAADLQEIESGFKEAVAGVGREEVCNQGVESLENAAEFMGEGGPLGPTSDPTSKEEASRSIEQLEDQVKNSTKDVEAAAKAPNNNITIISGVVFPLGRAVVGIAKCLNDFRKDFLYVFSPISKCQEIINSTLKEYSKVLAKTDFNEFSKAMKERKKPTVDVAQERKGPAVSAGKERKELGDGKTFEEIREMWKERSKADRRPVATGKKGPIVSA
ncbi:MAG: hypothetical protein ACD_21C00242G0002 [uncultured bacterium]|nr:MAG: hypothetical protein ACD_21C00242G0002 [uncultured bacterium]